MARARVCFVLLSVLLWHVTAACFIPFLSTPAVEGQVIAAADRSGNSAWVPSSIRTSELANAMRDSQLRQRVASQLLMPPERVPPGREPERMVRAHRSPYPTRQQLRLRLSRSDGGELPH